VFDCAQVVIVIKLVQHHKTLHGHTHVQQTCYVSILTCVACVLWCRAGRHPERDGLGSCRHGCRAPSRSARHAPNNIQWSERARSRAVMSAIKTSRGQCKLVDRSRTLMAETSSVGPFHRPLRSTAAASFPPRLPATNTSGGSAGGGGGGGGPPAPDYFYFFL
jgi:hypothetical protein